MNILAIETSCDETAISVIQTSEEKDNFKVLSDLVISQIETHAEYGGVFPALAKREHAKNLLPLLKQCILDSKLELTKKYNEVHDEDIHTFLEREQNLAEKLTAFLKSKQLPQIDMIMVTHGPGLAPALWVGVNFARALSVAFECPILPVNHMEGHISSILLKENYLHEQEALLPLKSFDFPMIALLISGGHTQIILVKNWAEYEIIGETIDDAVGEAFDKVARMLEMPYPGGPKISLAARQGIPDERVVLPRPLLNSKDYRFSFSGLKTAARYLIADLKEQNLLDEQMRANVAREFEYACRDVLLKKTFGAIAEYGAKGLIIAGGVSANTFIAESFKEKCEEYDIELFLPEKKMCGDNSLMIASAGFVNMLHGEKTTPQENITAIGNLKIS